MELRSFFVCVLSTSFLCAQAREGFGPGNQDWGFVEVRPKCNMFWWLYHTSATETYTDRPLIIWLQGGPGSSGSGSGNIKLTGPMDQNLELRDYTWVNKANMLYIDNPVGAGYSFVDTANGGTFVANTQEAAIDFITFLKGFFKVHPEFETVPLYIIGESYGGKFAPAYAQLIHEEVQAGYLKANLSGIGLEYPAIQLINNIIQYPDQLFYNGIVDSQGREELMKYVIEIMTSVSQGDIEKVDELHTEMQSYIFSNYGLSHFRVTENIALGEDEASQPFNEFMDEVVSPILNVSTPFEAQRPMVTKALKDKLFATTNSVTYLLDNTNIKVYFCVGQLDWITNIAGTYNLVKGLDWHGMDSWNAEKRQHFFVNGVHEGDVKKIDRLAFYWIKRAGHRLPADNPNAMDYFLKDLIGF